MKTIHILTTSLFLASCFAYADDKREAGQARNVKTNVQGVVVAKSSSFLGGYTKNYVNVGSLDGAKITGDFNSLVIGSALGETSAFMGGYSENETLIGRAR